MLPTRKIPECLRGGEIWNDIPDKIQKSLGGTPFFYEEEAQNIHRIGIGLGLGWTLPKYKNRKDRVNTVKIEINQRTGLLDMKFCNTNVENPEDGCEVISVVASLQYKDLREIYDRDMHGIGADKAPF